VLVLAFEERGGLGDRDPLEFALEQLLDRKIAAPVADRNHDLIGIQFEHEVEQSLLRLHAPDAVFGYVAGCLGVRDGVREDLEGGPGGASGVDLFDGQCSGARAQDKDPSQQGLGTPQVAIQPSLGEQGQEGEAHAQGNGGAVE
jgi:hypothetical protein